MLCHPAPATSPSSWPAPGRLAVTGVDLSRSFVEIATRYAAAQGVAVEFRPVVALNETYRVLRPGAVAVIHDLNGEATRDQIRREVAGMGVSRRDAAFTRLVLGQLRRRAASPERFRRLAAASDFGGCAVTAEGIGLEVRLTRPAG